MIKSKRSNLIRILALLLPFYIYSNVNAVNIRTTIDRMEGFLGNREMLLLDENSCSVSCSIHGTCKEDKCECNAGWNGQECNEAGICLSGCNGHGKCGDNGECVCIDGRKGNACEELSCKPECQNGKCLNGNCFCEVGFYGVDCSKSKCSNLDCGKQGKCKGGVCVCDKDYRGVTCQEKMLPGGSYDDSSSSFKSSKEDIKEVDSKAKAKHNTYSICENGCSGHGICIEGVCYCDARHDGKDCSIPLCGGTFLECSGRGTCEHGICKCSDGFTGDDCETKIEQDITSIAAQKHNPDSAILVSKLPETWLPPPGQTCVTFTLLHPNLSILDFTTEKRHKLESLTKESLKGLDSYSTKRDDRDASNLSEISVTTIGVDKGKDVEDLYSVSVTIQTKIPTSEVESALFKIKNTFQSVEDEHLQLVELPSEKEQCNIELIDCHCSGHGECDSKSVCQCNPTWSGASCAVKRCPADCSENGDCVDGECKCNDKWKGESCQIHTCSSDCNGHGSCTNDDTMAASCDCDEGFTGDSCKIHTSCAIEMHEESVDQRCSRHGTCKDNVCSCRSGWTGVNCEEETCYPSDCNGNGLCNIGKCNCNNGWKGDSCEIKTCIFNCNDRGTCDGNVCSSCDKGWVGEYCETSELDCPNNCNRNSNQGLCNDGKCECSDGWHGADCGIKHCKNDCSRNGFCQLLVPDGHLGGVCSCNQGWYEDDCSRQGCKKGLDYDEECSGHGECSKSRGLFESYGCKCQSPWSGDACDVETCEHDCVYGSCVDGSCMCDPGFVNSPEKNDCSVELCPSNCHSEMDQGRCEDERYCVCNSGWKGNDCNDKYEAILDVSFPSISDEVSAVDSSCPMDCSHHGECTKDGCKCTNGYIGESCACTEGCSGHGSCSAVRGVCECQAGWAGEECTLRSCEDIRCNDNGTCFDGICKCKVGFTGDNCSESVSIIHCAKASQVYCSSHCVGGTIDYLKDCDEKCNEKCLNDCIVADGKFIDQCFSIK